MYYKKRISFIEKTLLFLILLLVTMHSFFDMKMFFLFIMLLATYTFINRKLISHSRVAILAFLSFFLVITLYYFKAVNVEQEIEGSLVYYYLRVLVGMLLLFMLYSSLKNRRTLQVANKLLNYVIIIHLFFYFMQLYFLYMGKSINLVNWYNPDLEQRVNSIYLEGLFRPSGLFNEPGTYSIVMGTVLYAKYLLKNKIDAVLLFGMLSVLFTFSSQGIAMMLILFMIIMKKYFKFNIKSFSIMLGILMVLVLISPFLIDYVTARFFSGGKGDGSLLLRLYVLDTYLNLSIEDKLLGIGLGANIFLMSIADLGLWFTVTFYLGIFGALMILGWLLFVIKRMDILFMMLILLVTKIQLIYMPLWLFLIAVLVHMYYDKHDKKVRYYAL